MPLTPIQHKSHIPKCMFLAALGRPRFDDLGNCTFDGKIGIWRCSEPVEAKQNSKNHAKGDIYEKDVTVNAERYVDMMIETVLPAISDAYRPLGVSQVIVQHDGAPPHVGKYAEVLIDEFGYAAYLPVPDLGARRC